MPIQKLKEFLDSHHVKYLTISHSPAYTAQEIAASAHIPGKELAKTVMVKVDGKLAMAVLPAPYQIDFDGLKESTGAETVELATEDEFHNQFPTCESGTMPPFGNLYGMEVFVAEPLTEDVAIVFQAGSHTELIQLLYEDFERLVQPMILKFAKAA